ncbi:hypothetical protein ACWDZ4_23240 [Streptomyces sp. NPDC003016]
MGAAAVAAAAAPAGYAAAPAGAPADEVLRYPAAPGHRLNVRSGPGTQYRLTKTLPYDVRAPVHCQKPGETATGPYGTSNLWDNIADGQFVSDAYVNTGRDGHVAPRCA